MNKRSSSAPARQDANLRLDVSKLFVRGDMYARTFRSTGSEDSSALERLSRTTYSLSAKAYPSLPPASPRRHRGPVTNHLPAFRRLPRRSVDEIVTRVSSASNGAWRRMHEESRRETAARRASTPAARPAPATVSASAAKQRNNLLRPEWIFY